MAWGFRASTFAASASITFPGNVTLGAALSSGDRIIVAAFTRRSGSPPTTPTITDNVNAGNYTEDTFTTFTDGTTQCRASFYSHTSAAGTPVVTCTSASSVGGFTVAGYSGLLASDPGTDKVKATAGVGGTASSGASAATTAANELTAGAYLDSGWSFVLTGNGGTTLTQRGVHENDTVDYQCWFGDKDSGTSGTTQTTDMKAAFPGSSNASTTWGMLAAVYQLAGAVSTIPPGLGPVVQMQQEFHHDNAMTR